MKAAPHVLTSGGYFLLAVLTVQVCGGQAPAAGRSLPPAPEASAGIFIGVEEFAADFSLTRVTFAVNDAVDLAFTLTLEHKVLLPNRVLLLLAGQPLGESRARLAELLAAGARREQARQADIYTLVSEQSRLVEEEGLLVLTIATHGFAWRNEHLLLAEDSLLEFGTGVTIENLLRATQAGPKGRRLLVIDACREELVRSSRRGSSVGVPEPRAAMVLDSLQPLANQNGYAVLSAAGTGEYAYSAPSNGYFTRALLEGLRCRKGEDAKSLRGVMQYARDEVIRVSGGRQHPELRESLAEGDLPLFGCDQRQSRSTVQGAKSAPLGILEAQLVLIEKARNLAEAGGSGNTEQSFQLYRRVFDELPPAVLDGLNQGLVARAQQLQPDSRRDEALRLYRQLLDPLLGNAPQRR